MTYPAAPMGVSTGSRPPGRLVLHTDGALDDRVVAKTAWVLLRFAPERVRAVVDPVHAGRPLGEVCPGLDLDIPVVASVAAGAEPGDTLVIGTARNGGALSAGQRDAILWASAQGMEVLNGTHDVVDAPGVVNMRVFRPEDRRLGEARPRGPTTRILTVGSTGSVGKMTVTVLLARALQAAGHRADWLPTGQTGVILRGLGHVLDAVPLDFAPGVLEHDLAVVERDVDVVVIEGQGALLHPMWGAASFIFTKVAKPDWLVVCARMGPTHHLGFDVPIPDVLDVVAAHRALATVLGQTYDVLGVALDSADVDRATYDAERARIETALGVPCVDPVRTGVDDLVARLASPTR
jgi:uncharacterized NAD-dependent epimerase/dehydratase family protein